MGGFNTVIILALKKNLSKSGILKKINKNPA